MDTDKNQTGLLDGWINGLMDAGTLANDPAIQQSSNPIILGLICVHLWLKFRSTA